jgi:hypothetical protein
MKTKPLRFGSWLCSHLQVKMSILLALAASTGQKGMGIVT